MREWGITVAVVTGKEMRDAEPLEGGKVDTDTDDTEAVERGRTWRW